MHIHPDMHTYIFPRFRHSGKNLELRKRETEGFEGEPKEISGHEEAKDSLGVFLAARRKKNRHYRRRCDCRSVTYPRDRGLHRSGLVQERRLDRGPRKSCGKTGCPRNGPASQWHKPLLTCARIRVRSLKRIIV